MQKQQNLAEEKAYQIKNDLQPQLGQLLEAISSYYHAAGDNSDCSINSTRDMNTEPRISIGVVPKVVREDLAQMIEKRGIRLRRVVGDLEEGAQFTLHTNSMTADNMGQLINDIKARIKELDPKFDPQKFSRKQHEDSLKEDGRFAAMEFNSEKLSPGDILIKLTAFINAVEGIPTHSKKQLLKTAVALSKSFNPSSPEQS